MKGLFFLLLSAFVLVSCEKDFLFFWDRPENMENDKFIYSSSPVFDVIAPSSVKYGDTISIQVRSVGNTGCSGFSHYNESKTGRNTVNLMVIQKQPKEVFCTMVLKTITSSYEFVPDERQQYTFNFWRGELHENDVITVQIKVR